MYVTIFKVRELLILCYVLLMFVDLFIDWGSPSNNLSDYISGFVETQLTVVSRTSLVSLVAGVKFRLAL